MDTATLAFVLATVGGIAGAGFAGAGVAARQPNLSVVTGGGSSDADTPGPDQTLPRQPWWWIGPCWVCPLFLAGAIAAGLWSILDAAMGVPTPQPAVVFVAAGVVGLVAGGAVTAVYNGVVSTLR